MTHRLSDEQQRLLATVNFQALEVDEATDAELALARTCFEEAVALLRDFLPCPPLNRLMASVWEIIGSGKVKVALAAVQTMTFMALGSRSGAEVALVLLPEDFVARFRQAPLFAYGSIVYNGSKVRDYAEGRLLPAEAAEARALAHEAEFLLAREWLRPGALLGAYQRTVLQRYPRGLASLDAALA